MYLAGFCSPDWDFHPWSHPLWRYRLRQTYTKDGSFLPAIIAFGCTKLVSKSAKLHLFNSWSRLPAASFPHAMGHFPRGSSLQPFHPFPLLKIFQDSSKRGEATALNTFQGGNRREFTSLIFLASWKPDFSRQRHCTLQDDVSRCSLLPDNSSVRYSLLTTSSSSP